MVNMEFQNQVENVLLEYKDICKKAEKYPPLRTLVDMMFKKFDRSEMLSVKDSIARLTDVGFSNMFWDEYRYYYL